MDTKKMLLIMNPISGLKKAPKLLPEIVSLFNRADYDVITYITGAQGDAARVAARLGGHVDLVVCSGGDGTFNETITGLLTKGIDVPVGYLPSGTTNDFASSLKLSTNPLRAAQDILEGKPNVYDVGKFGNRYFSYVASFGIFTQASYTTPQSVKNVLGHAAYVLSGISELSQIRKEHVRMEIDGEVVEDDFLFGAISNATCVGGILTLDSRHVDLSDGLLEILLIRAPENLLELHECIQALQNQDYDNCAMVTFRHAHKLTVQASPDMPWTLDGEREDGHGEVVVENVQHAIRLIQREE